MPESREFSILGIGSLPFDRLVYFGPDDNEIAAIGMPGGSAGNVLCALAALGARPAIASVVGEDGEGRRTGEHLRDFGVDVRWLQRKAGRKTRRVRIEVREAPGHPPAHRFVHAPVGKSVVSLRGLNPEPGWIQKALDAFDWFHFDATTKAVRQLARGAAERGKPVSYDFGRPPLWGIAPALELIESCSVLKTNRPLVSALVQGNDLAGPADPARLFSRFPRLEVLLVTDGENDAELLLKTGQGIERAARAVTPISRFVDAVGAGDACTASLIHSVWKAMQEERRSFSGQRAEETLRDLTAFAALVCQFPGATGYLYWLRAQAREAPARPLREIMGAIAEKGAVPDSFHFPASDWEKYSPGRG